MGFQAVSDLKGWFSAFFVQNLCEITAVLFFSYRVFFFFCKKKKLHLLYNLKENTIESGSDVILLPKGTDSGALQVTCILLTLKFILMVILCG